MKTPLVLYGAGGHARSVAEVIRRAGRFRIACALDDAVTGSADSVGEVIGGRDALASLPPDVRTGFVAIGDNAVREELATALAGHGLALAIHVDPAAVVATGVEIGVGTVLMPFSLAAASTSIGRGVILNTAATVDHDSVVGDFAHLSVDVHLGGGCSIGPRAFVGMGALVANGIRIGASARIGAGAVVLEDVPDGGFVAGIPARKV